MANHDHHASRTLVKSAPELWAECSDAASLAKHLGAFGEIRITKLEPETAVVWEGEAARGTVRLEPSGWGTRVVLTAGCAEPAQQPPAQPSPEPAQQPSAGPSPEPVEVPATPPRGLLSRIFHLWHWRPGPAADSADAAAGFPPEEAPAPDDDDNEDEDEDDDGGGEATRDALDSALDSLGSAHHRPYSRA